MADLSWVGFVLFPPQSQRHDLLRKLPLLQALNDTPVNLAEMVAAMEDGSELEQSNFAARVFDDVLVTQIAQVRACTLLCSRLSASDAPPSLSLRLFRVCSS